MELARNALEGDRDLEQQPNALDRGCTTAASVGRPYAVATAVGA